MATSEPTTPTGTSYKISSVTGKRYRAHGTGGKDSRGSAAERRARRTWIVSPTAGFGGDGVKVPCVHCGAMVAKADVHIDRIECGATYRRSNIQPACAGCNWARGDNPDWIFGQ